jgi:hypothetical protein
LCDIFLYLFEQQVGELSMQAIRYYPQTQPDSAGYFITVLPLRAQFSKLGFPENHITSVEAIKPASSNG